MQDEVDVFYPAHGIHCSCAACGTTYTTYPSLVLINGVQLVRLYRSEADWCLMCDAALDVESSA